MNILAGSAVTIDGLGDAAVVALLGYGVVFLGLVLLMTVVMLLGKIFVIAGNRKKAEAPVAAVAVAAGPVAAAVEEGPSKVNVVLTAAGANKIAVIKIVRDLTGLGLKEAKDIADNGGNVKEGIDKAEAEQIKAQFEEAGATVELK